MASDILPTNIKANTKLSAMLNEDAMVEGAARVGSADVFKDNYVFPWRLPFDGMFFISFFVFLLFFPERFCF